MSRIWVGELFIHFIFVLFTGLEGKLLIYILLVGTLGILLQLP